MPKLPEKIQAIIVDTDNAFIVRLDGDPRTTDTGIANVIPRGAEREHRDYAIKVGKHLVKCWNEYSEANPTSTETKSFKLIKHNSEDQLTWGHHGYEDTRTHLKEGEVYKADEVMHEWHTEIIIDNKSYNSVCFEGIEVAHAND